MLLSRAGNTIVITIETFWDWMDLFDNGVVDEISFDLDAEILDAFFPDWDTYVDSDRPLESLKMDDLKQIDTIHILIATDVQEVEDLEGEGFYNVVACECDLANTALDQVDAEQPDFEDFLDYTGTVTFKITPDHPEP
ncbi:MAG: hypothetical protein IKS64_04035 [Muribaculaceae bacterium]|nr:hypothetical protein [Muribaculaceae bacterium]